MMCIGFCHYKILSDLGFVEKKINDGKSIIKELIAVQRFILEVEEDVNKQ